MNDIRPKRRGALIHCATCGQPFRRQTARQTYCSHDCTPRTGAHNNRFNGYTTRDARGYLRFTSQHPEHPGKYAHAVLWAAAHPEGKCERCGQPAEQVHHIDEDKTNNALENLQGLCRACHSGLHAKERELWRTSKRSNPDATPEERLERKRARFREYARRRRAARKAAVLQ